MPDDGRPRDERFGDYVQPFQVEDLGVRGRLVRLEGALGKALRPHGYPDAVAGMLAETAALAAMLSSTLKFDGIFTLQAQGDGPIGTLMADVNSAGGFRAYARFDGERLAESGDSPPRSPVGRLLGSGHVAFTVDQGTETDRYQGITQLAGETLAECVQAYFRHSEQLETAIMVKDSGPRDGRGRRAAALMIQRLPDARPGIDEWQDDAWRRAVILMSSLSQAELMDAALGAEELLFRLFHADGLRVYRPRPVYHTCRCSREKVAVTLASFPREEITALAEDDGRVTVTCEFCKTDYRFDAEELDRLFDERGTGPSGSA